ncbi:putative brown planthopper susceptibility protein [Hordeum vulgare]|nr:putative brown planthopper susceptibility protein [Hordeum vulgare]
MEPSSSWDLQDNTVRQHPQHKTRRIASMACINTLQSCSMFKGAKAEARRGSRAAGGGSFGCRASTFMDGSGLRLGLDENPDAIISGEWPENFSLLSYDDLRAYLQSQQQQQQQPPSHAGDQHRGALLREAMSTPVLMATADQTLVEVEGHFQLVSGLPVVDSARRCVGVVVKSDRARASHGSRTKIADVMTSPAITLSCDKTVTDAAALMLKKKIHRLPIVNQDNQVIGIVTRDDVLRALEAMLKF